jgi:hypothetical protein
LLSKSSNLGARNGRTGGSQNPAMAKDVDTMEDSNRSGNPPRRAVSDPAQPTRFCTWPDGTGTARPRSAPVVIGKRAGGLIGN